jgi:hypothetical protein
MTMAKSPTPQDLNRVSAAWPAMESRELDGTISFVTRWFDRLVCRYAAHDWWSLAYPPARRWECRRCGMIVEEAPTSTPDRRRVPRDKTKRANGPTLD